MSGEIGHLLTLNSQRDLWLAPGKEKTTSIVCGSNSRPPAGVISLLPTL